MSKGGRKIGDAGSISLQEFINQRFAKNLSINLHEVPELKRLLDATGRTTGVDSTGLSLAELSELRAALINDPQINLAHPPLTLRFIFIHSSFSFYTVLPQVLLWRTALRRYEFYAH